MTFPIGNDSNCNIGRTLQRGVEESVRRAADPLNLFGGDSFGCKGASGLFPKGAGGCGGIEDILAALGGKGKGEANMDTSNCADLNNGGKDFGSTGQGGGGGGGMGDMLGGIMQGIMGLVKNLLGGLLGGGGGGGGIMGMLGGL